MRHAISRITSHQMFRAAIAAPIAIMLIFSVFNLTAPVDQTRLASSITIGVVNLDEGVPAAPEPVANRLMAGLGSGLPLTTLPFAEEETAREALDNGDVTAVLVFPADFSASVLNGGTGAVRVLATQHLSLAETQFVGNFTRQIEGSMSAAVLSMRAAAGAPEGASAPAVPPITIAPEYLYVAPVPAALSAPFVMTFATWLAAFVGGLMAFLATRAVKGASMIPAVSIVRTMLPILVPIIAGLMLALIVAWTTGGWDNFLGLWLFIWLATAAIALLVAGLFSLLGFFAILLVLPAVFYQGALSGTQAPIGAAPDWLRSIGEALPFDSIGTGYRTLVIGGPSGTMPIVLLLATAVVGAALIWIGTWLHHRRESDATPAA